MSMMAFADESGTDSKCHCYSIGVVTIDAAARTPFEQKVLELKTVHGVVGEAKWTRIRNSHGAINFALDCLKLIATHSSTSLDVMVVHKPTFRNWQGDANAKERAFYQTYTFLLEHVARRVGTDVHVLIDDRSDRYPKRDEAMRAIGNRMLARLASNGQLKNVAKSRSDEVLGIQVADVLTGAINTAHLLKRQPQFTLHAGKRLAMKRLAEQLGWDRLSYDTLPNDRLNIWHFPIETRGPTRAPRHVKDVHYVKASDIL